MICSCDMQIMIFRQLDAAKIKQYKESCSQHPQEGYNEDNQRNLKFTSEDQVREGLLGIIVNRLKSGSYKNSYLKDILRED
ncbi:hypothetical protein Tco_0029444, partial [Tanacetum coccineum]